MRRNVLTLDQFLNESQPPWVPVKMSDDILLSDIPVNRFSGKNEFETKLIRFLKKDPDIREHIKKEGLYIDGQELVLGEKTVSIVIGANGIPLPITIRKIKDKILQTSLPEKIQAPEHHTHPISRFHVEFPTSETSKFDLNTHRMIVTATDEEALLIKQKIHNPKAGIKVRIMKRKDGSKVYIDADTEDGLTDALCDLEIL